MIRSCKEDEDKESDIEEEDYYEDGGLRIVPVSKEVQIARSQLRPSI